MVFATVNSVATLRDIGLTREDAVKEAFGSKDQKIV
jgi:hypothetical protein